ncbi:hypothetical protein A2866_05255 [Candidatus Roizmanbacteria bacterium RIFCSPHIGHO2_01_FULL_39_8]|uniref:Uncharacterized protein n=2 Tax=Candidatus Roizmaniibacteriota TaxID=1752723 RepID=A0A1F7GJG3_9BACT|nr:MAG: hypothetical protein A2866_05255 [Candidatus Roizmanbacteria bacterium RIFCSPHIGHO2_01_FULL_39_8]OGK28616.1 MAG: hypothetical protein A3C28_03115 [Candidatus Roizmanbacteria bacterium RIFCSPHIGHO2_02_FULL_39_9]
MRHEQILPPDEIRYLLGKTSIKQEFRRADFLADRNFIPMSASLGGTEFDYYVAPAGDVSDLPFPRQARFIGAFSGEHVIIVPGEIASELRPIHAYRELIKAQMLVVDGIVILDDQISLEVETERRALSAVSDGQLAARYAQDRSKDTVARIRYVDELMEQSLRDGACDRGKIFELDFVKDELEQAARLLLGYSGASISVRSAKDANLNIQVAH